MKNYVSSNIVGPMPRPLLTKPQSNLCVYLLKSEMSPKQNYTHQRV